MYTGNSISTDWHFGNASAVNMNSKYLMSVYIILARLVRWE